METAIFVSARLGSTRLKRKHLLPVNKQPIFQVLLQRIVTTLKNQINNGKIHVIITSADEPENRKLEKIFCNRMVSIFYGSSYNIPLRHLQCAQFHGIKNLVSVDGDDILCSMDGVEQVLYELARGACYVSTKNLPLGMNSFGYSTSFLEKSLQSNTEKIIETDWRRIFEPSFLEEIDFHDACFDDSLRFTLDYQEDYEFFKSLIEQFGETLYQASAVEIVQFVQKHNLNKLNQSAIQKFWTNFNTGRETESQ